VKWLETHEDRFLKERSNIWNLWFFAFAKWAKYRNWYTKIPGRKRFVLSVCFCYNWSRPYSRTN